MKVKCTTEHWDFFTSGKEYEVLHKAGGKYYVNDDDGDENELWDYECEFVEESNQQAAIRPAKEFKIGDKVKIVKKFSECDICHHGEAWTDCWVPEMDETIGEVGTIIHIMCNGYNVAFGGSSWKYPSDSLELVQISEHLVEEIEITKDISYQEFLEAFDEEACPSITARKHEAFIEVNDQSFMCYTKEREQEVMRALIVLYGKNVKEKIDD